MNKRTEIEKTFPVNVILSEIIEMATLVDFSFDHTAVNIIQESGPKVRVKLVETRVVSND